jgi:ribosomal silencing factor RsfS
MKTKNVVVADKAAVAEAQVDRVVQVDLKGVVQQVDRAVVATGQVDRVVVDNKQKNYK